MLNLLIVPKGTRYLLSNSSASYDVRLDIALVAPHYASRIAPGDVIATHEGFLHEGKGILGQNPVEHLKLTGSLVELSFSNGTSTLNANGLPSYAGVPWVIIPTNTRQDGSGTSSTKYVHHVVPYGGMIACTAKRPIPPGYSGAGKLFALHGIWGWCSEDSWFSATGTASERTTSVGGKWSQALTVTVVKFNSGRTATGSATRSQTVGNYSYNPVFADPAQWLGAVIEIANQLANSITTYGSSYAPSTSSWFTTKEPNAHPVLPHLGGFQEKFFPQDLNPDRWGDLASDCYGQIQCWDGNAAAYLRDSVLMGSSAKQTIALAKSLIGSKNPVKIAKSLASLFLSFRYGWCLQVRDSLSLMEIDFGRAYPQGLARRSASRTYERNGVPVTARMGVYFQPYSSKISELEGFLRSVDLELSLENIWDFVPFSFVVDWFTGLGDLLDRMDQMAQVDSYDIRLVGRSFKTAKSMTYQKTTGVSSWHGLISAVYYKRHYQTEPIQPSLLSYRNPNQNFDHWLEGTALIVQRL